MSPKRKRSDPKTTLLFLVIGMGVFLATCIACWAVAIRLAPNLAPSGDTEPATTALRLAYSPEKQVFFEGLVADFNAQALVNGDGEQLRVETLQLDPEAMIDAALAGEVQAIVPDSSIWLDALDRSYAERVSTEEIVGGGAGLTSEVTRWAVSPVVIAMWDETAREMGWPERSIGWVDLLNRAQRDPDFKWSHAATNSASGLLATLAEFYAGAGITRGLTEDLARSQEVVEYVSCQ